MTQKEKQLLLIDLCARLLYGVTLMNPNKLYRRITNPNTSIGILVDEGWLPCLRPLSSMIEEERKEYHSICDSYTNREGNKYYFNNVLTIDWYNRKHFDYRGLIEKNLALQAPKGLYTH